MGIFFKFVYIVFMNLLYNCELMNFVIFRGIVYGGKYFLKFCNFKIKIENGRNEYGR